MRHYRPAAPRDTLPPAFSLPGSVSELAWLRQLPSAYPHARASRPSVPGRETQQDRVWICEGMRRLHFGSVRGSLSGFSSFRTRDLEQRDPRVAKGCRTSVHHL